MGERIEPARDVPPPFCGRGLRPPPRTSALVSWALVPARPALRYAVTTWCTSASLNSLPKIASETASSAPPLATLSFMLGTAYFLAGVAGLATCCLGRRDLLAILLRRGLHRRTHDDLAAFGARNRAADQQQVALDVDLDDLEVLDGAANHTHVARHALALEHAARRLALADRARRSVRHGHTVRGMVTGEVVTLHRAGEALADRGARDIDDRADFEDGRP